jgi:WD40 repeat protein
MDGERSGAPEEPLELVVEVWRAKESAREAPPSAEFLFEPQAYVRILEGKPASGSFAWSRRLLADLDALRGDKMDRPAAEQVGAEIAELLGGLGFRDDARRMVEALAAGRRVHLTLRFAAAELGVLPWELVRLGAGPLAVAATSAKEREILALPLGALPGCLVRYEWPGTRTAAPSPAPAPEGGRILFAWSAAGGAVPALHQASAIGDACREAGVAFDVARDIMPNVSLAGLRAALAAGPVAILHVLCHGGLVASRRGAYGLVWNDDEEPGARDVIDAATLRELLAPHLGSLRLVVLCTCHGGDAGALDNRLGSVAQELHGAGVPAVVASRYPLGTDAADDLTDALYRVLLVASRSLEEAVLAARERLHLRPRRVDWASLQLLARAADGPDHRPVVLRPYRSLSAFRQADHALFFGREGEIDAVLRALDRLGASGRPRFLVVSGDSGSGKSSLVQAGVVPRLPGHDGPAPVLTPDALATLDGRPRVLVVDQLEELLVVPGRDALLARAWALANAGSTVLLSARSDRLPALEALPVDGGRTLGQLVGEGHHHRIACMAPAQLRAAVTEPARRVGVELEGDLADRILAEVRGQPGGLPLVEYLLDELWRRRDGRVLTVAAYNALGGVRGALERRADAVCADIGDAALRPLLLGLVGVGDAPHADTRLRAAVEELCARSPDPTRTAEALERLVDERLLVTSRDGERRTVEVAHETLIREWKRFRRLVDADRDRLADLRRFRELLAQLGEGLLEGNVLDRARAVLARSRGDLAPLEIARIDESARRDRDARLVRAAREAMGWDPARALLLLGELREPARAAGWAMAAIDALGRPFARRTSAPRMWTVSGGALSPDGSRAAASSGETIVWAIDGDTEPVVLADRALVQADAPFLFSDDGTRLMVAGADQAVRVYDAATGAPLVTLHGNGWPRHYLLAGDGSAGVASFEDDGLVAWLGGAEVVALPPTPIRRLLAVEGGPEPRALVLDTAGRIVRLMLPGAVPEVYFQGLLADAGVAASGDLLFVDTDARRILSMQPNGSTTVVAELLRTHPFCNNVRFADGGKVIAAGDGSSTQLYRFDATTRGMVMPLWTGEGELVDLAASGDRLLVLRGGRPTVIDVLSGIALAEIPVEGIQSARFRAGGAEVVTLGWQGTAQVWHAAGPPAPVQQAMGLGEPRISPDGAAWAGFEKDLWTASAFPALLEPLAGMSGEIAPVTRKAWGPVRSIAWTLDGAHMVVAAERDGGTGVGIVPVGKGDEEMLAPDLPWTVNALAAGPGALVAAAGREPHNTHDAAGAPVHREHPPGKLHAWRAGASLALDVATLSSELVSVAFDAGGTRLAAGDRNGRAFLWDLETGARVAELSFAGGVRALSFHPHAPRLLVGTKGGEVVLVDLATSTRRTLHVFVQGRWAWELAFSPDGRRAALVGSQPEVFVVDVDGDAAPIELDGHQERAVSARFSPDGAFLTTSARDHTVRRWPIDPARLMTQVREATRWSPVLRRQALESAGVAPDER